MTSGRRLVIAATALVLLGGIVGLQMRLTASKDRSWFTERMTFLPRSDKVTRLFGGFTSTYANYLWIRTMLYFGGQYLGAHDFAYLGRMVDIVTRLNPYYYPAYEFAGLMLPAFAHNPDMARLLLQRGLNHLDHKRYRIAFYLGYLYFDSYHDLEMAANYYALAAADPEAPPHVAGLAATLYSRAGMDDAARYYLQSLFHTTENPAVRRMILDKLAKLDSGS